MLTRSREKTELRKLLEADNKTKVILKKPAESSSIKASSSSHADDHNCNGSTSKLVGQRQNNLVRNFYESQLGFDTPNTWHKRMQDAVVKDIATFRICTTSSPFDRRVTVLVWHPTHPKMLAVGSKGGDIVVWNYKKHVDRDGIILGQGPGCSVQAMKFNELNPVQLYTASINGTVSLWDYETKSQKIILGTSSCNKWYTSMDVNPSNKSIVAGDNTGLLTLLSSNGRIIVWQKKIHKQKVTHAEFSTRENWLLATTSIDNTVKLWDVRFLNPEEPLLVMKLDHGINSAYFSLTDGGRLLVTDQHSQLRVYRGPLWNLETMITHPHRQFQHLTPIKAYWHPMLDIVLVGRYPDENIPGYTEYELRTIDFYDAGTGQMVHQLSQPGVHGIFPLNRFNHVGDSLASAMGFNTFIWRPNGRAHLVSSVRRHGCKGACVTQLYRCIELKNKKAVGSGNNRVEMK